MHQQGLQWRELQGLRGQCGVGSFYRMPIIRLFSVASVLVLVVFAAAVYGTLPDRIPTHFDFSGTATTFSDKRVWNWFDLTLAGVGSWALVTGIGGALPSRPHWFNFPEKERFLALPSEYQGPVIAEMRTMLDIVALGTALLFLSIHVTAWRVALGHEAGGFAYAPLAAILIAPLTLMWLPRLNRTVEAQERRWQGAAKRQTTGVA